MTNLSVPEAVNLERHERVTMLVEAVGGQRRAAEIADVNADTINNWRKPGVRLPIDGMLQLCEAGGVSLDWVATGEMVRPDLQARYGIGKTPPGFELLHPLRASAEEGAKAEVAVDEQWLEREFGLPVSAARYVQLDDDGMAPRLGKGALVLVDVRPARLVAGVYLLAAGEDWIARRLYRMPGGVIEFTADGDPNWRFRVEKQELPKMHRIVWAGQSL